MAKRKAAAPPPDPDEFNAFWAIYPLKVAKLAALRSFGRARAAASFEDIMDGLRRYKPKPGFIAHPATWLNGGRWMDEPEPEVDLLSNATPRNGTRFHPASADGIAAWAATAPDVGYDLVGVAGEILDAAGFPEGAQLDYGPIINWLKAGIDSEAAAGVIRDMVARGARPATPSLRYFSKAIMEKAER